LVPSVPSPSRLVIIAPPSPLGVWTVLVARQLLSALAGSAVETIELDSDEATSRFLANPPPGAALVVAHYPRTALIEHSRREALPVVLALDEPDQCVAFHLENAGGTLHDALRPLSQSLSLIAGFAGLSQKTVIIGADRGRTAEVIIARMASALSVGKAGQLAVKAMTALAVAPDMTVGQSIEKLALHGASLQPRIDGLEDYERATIGQVTGGIFDLCLGRDASEIVWHYEFFYDGGTFTSPAPMMIDMAGPARCIYYGPFLHLPAGRWDARIFLGFSNEVSETHVKVDIFTDDIVENFVGKVTRGGIYTMPVTFDVVDPRQPIQLRVFIDRGEIEGRMGLAMARLSPNRDSAGEQDHPL
jgi:hypothetical protein